MSVSKYRKRPVEVSALRYDGPAHVSPTSGTDVVRERDEFKEVREFVRSNFTTVFVGSVTHGGPNQYAPAIRTLEGTMRIDPGDFVIKGVKGEFYPCKPDIFETTYEAVETPGGRINR